MVWSSDVQISGRESSRVCGSVDLETVLKEENFPWTLTVGGTGKALRLGEAGGHAGVGAAEVGEPRSQKAQGVEAAEVPVLRDFGSFTALFPSSVSIHGGPSLALGAPPARPPADGDLL